MVFDGFMGLATLPDQDLSEPAASIAAQPIRDNGGEHVSLAPTHATHSPPEAAPVPRPAVPEHPAPAIEPAPESAAQPLLTPLESSRETVVPPRAMTSPESVRQEPWSTGDEAQTAGGAEPRRSRVSVAWSAGAALLFAVLFGQAAYAYRVELVANYPGLKPIVAQFCGMLGCSVPLPQRPKLINIEASDLQIQDPARPSVIQLTATLRNHAGYEVGFPALDLVLTNTKEHTLARRIFMPDEYLDTDRNAAAGLAANAEITVRLVLDTGALGAAGFRLALLPAHSR
jgi:hypothetical protein